MTKESIDKLSTGTHYLGTHKMRQLTITKTCYRT